MRSTFTIYRPGTTVEIGPEKDPISATVLQVTIRDCEAVLYEVCWWLSGRQTAWMYGHELRHVNGRSRSDQIGFIAECQQ